MGRRTILNQSKRLGVAKQGQPSVADYAVIREPIFTEKSAQIGDAGRVIVFRVPPEANKVAIREAVTRIFGVTVDKVRTLNVLGKPKMTAKSKGRRANYKKAYVTLAKGQTIPLIDGV